MLQLFRPESHYFVDQTAIELPDTNNVGSDSFGPVKDFLTTKYRTTSVIRTNINNTTPVKVFAICDGQILIQPNTDDSTKLNLILKPSISYAPLKIKYFIYRGVNKSDIINEANIKSPVTNSPTFVSSIWAKYIDVTTKRGLSAPTVYPAKLVGFDPTNQPESSTLDSCFFKRDTIEANEYEVPNCVRGEHIAYFTGSIGLDIVLDYGDFSFSYQNQVFKFDLRFARDSENVFDTDLMDNDTKKKQLKEYIYQFIDPPAFWAAHINLGKIFIFNETLPKSGVQEIYDLFVNKYQTRHKIYYYIKGDRDRSYNYYSDDINYKYPTGEILIDFPGVTKTHYDTEGWPIIIMEMSQSTLSSNFDVSLECDINSDIIDSDINLATCLIFPYVGRESLLSTGKLLGTTLSGQTKKLDPKPYFITILDGSNYKSVASFYFHFFRGKQILPLKDYLDDLWFFNIENIFTIASESGVCSWVVAAKNYLPNLYSMTNIEAIKVQHKVVFDEGKIGDIQVKRRLYIVAIDEARGQTKFAFENIGKFNSNTSLTSGFEVLKNDNYSKVLYGKEGFKIYRGVFNDGASIFSLVLHNDLDFELKQSFIQLGITEEEYNKLLYNNSTIPSPLPAVPHISLDAANITLYLEPDLTLPGPSFTKYRVGLKYEDADGSIVVKFPSAANNVFVYTVDSLFLFSAKYSESQIFYEKFSDTVVHFRPLPTWDGNFGFDWVRNGNSGLPGDSAPPPTATIDRKYSSILGRYFDSSSSDKKIGDEPIEAYGGSFELGNEFQKLHRLYSTYPLNSASETLYAAPWISLYPSFDNAGNNTGFPKSTPDGTAKCITEARLNLKIVSAVPTPTQLKFVYKKDFIEVTSVTATDTTTLPDITDGNGVVYANLQINKNSAGAYPSSIEIRLKSKKETISSQIIKIKSIDNNGERIAGELYLFANAKSQRKELECVLVNCNTNVVATQNVLGIDATNENLIVNEMTRGFNQALIDVSSFTTIPLPLTRAVKPDFYTSYATVNAGQPYQEKTGSIWPMVPHDYLLAYLDTISPVSSDKLIIFCIDEYCVEFRPTQYYRINGATKRDEATQVFYPITILFKSGLYKSSNSNINEKSISVHEALHGLGLGHSYSNFNMFSFKIFYTDNIMDYYDGLNTPSLSPSTQRLSTNRYQWIASRYHEILKTEQ